MEELKEKAKQLKREYYREWRAKNKDRVKAINERYWQKKALKEQEN